MPRDRYFIVIFNENLHWYLQMVQQLKGGAILNIGKIILKLIF